ncbi:MAG: feruloyl-CoA synthase [Sedimentitalea sp.]
MKRTTRFQPHDVRRTDRRDGAILLSSGHSLPSHASKTGEWLHRWANDAPARIFLAERSGKGWRSETYAATLQKVLNLASSLLARGMGRDTPLLIMSGNSVDHALLSLAAQYIGVPSVPIAEQYSLIQAAHPRLVQAVELVRPKMAYVSDAVQYAAALDLDAMVGIDIVASVTGGKSKITSFDALVSGSNGVDLAPAYASVNGDTVAKILMTSGSTSAPKGVLTTQTMMCVNQAQLADSLPFLHDRPPRLLDWLPWNHVFGGSHNFNMILANGGTLHIDDGKPAPGLFERTLENHAMAPGTLSFNVPVGYSLLAKALGADPDLRQTFFADLDLMFYAGASLPQDVWQALEKMAVEVKGEVPLMTSSWGLTETAPAILLQTEPIDRSGIVGAPLAGITVKLIPDADMRCEARVKGPNVMQGYFENPDKTRDAFDEEGFFITGDAMVFVDPDDPNKGLRFDGRISEDFKLLTGTWVRAAQLRIEALECLAPLAADVVVTGADRDEIGLMIFPNLAEMTRHGYAREDVAGALNCPKLLSDIEARLKRRAKDFNTSSTRIARVILLAEPPSMPEGESTAKGNLNFRKVLTRRADLLARLYSDADPAVITV